MKFDIEGWDDALLAPAFPIGTKPNLHPQDISHGLGGFFLCRSGDMGIGVQCEPSRKVTQHAGHGLDVHTILERDGCEGVAEVMEPNLRDARSLRNPLQHVIYTVRGNGSATRRGKHIGVIGFPFLFFQGFCRLL